MRSKLKTDVKYVSGVFNTSEVVDFLGFNDGATQVALDTETMNINMRGIIDRYRFEPNDRLTVDAIWERVKKDTNAASYFSERLANQGVIKVFDKWTKVQFNTLFVKTDVKSSSKAEYTRLNDALDPESSRVACVQLGTKIGNEIKVVVIQVKSTNKRGITELLGMLEGKTLIIQNADFDIRHIYSSFGVHLNNRIIDTKTWASLLNGGKDDSGMSLKDLCVQYNLPEKFRKSEEHPLEIDWNRTTCPEALGYAVSDITSILLLKDIMKEKISEQGLASVALLEAKLAPILIGATIRGIRIDTDSIKVHIEELEKEKREAQEHIPVAAPIVSKKAELLRWVNAYFGVSLGSLEKKAFYSNMENVNNEPLRKCMESLITVASCDTQLSHLYKLVGKKTFHPTYISTPTKAYELGSVDGGSIMRMSAKPAIQNIPKHRRHHYIAREGYKLICSDYNAIEFWVMAEMSGEPTMLSLGAKGIDPHTYLATKIFQKPMEEVTKAERQIAKTANFSFIFGAWHTTFMLKLLSDTKGEVELTESEALNIRSEFFKTYSKLQEFLDRQFCKGVLNGYVETLEGRKRYWNRPQFLKNRESNASKGKFVAKVAPIYAYDGRILSRDEMACLPKGTPVEKYTDLAVCERATDWSWRNICYNSPVQGTAGDGLKQAALLIPDWLHQLIYVHDQFVVECPEDRVEEGIPLLEDAMREGMGLYLKNAPIKMETEVGDVWC